MIRLLVEERTVRIDKVLGTGDVRLRKSWDDVYILESPVEYGNRHALTTESDVVQTLSLEHLQLILAVAVSYSLDAVPGVESLVIGVFDVSVDGIGGCPYTLGLCDAVKCSQMF